MYGQLRLSKLTERIATFKSRVKRLQMPSVWSKITDINMSQILKIFQSFSEKGKLFTLRQKERCLDGVSSLSQIHPITRPTSSAFERLSLEKKKGDHWGSSEAFPCIQPFRRPF